MLAVLALIVVGDLLVWSATSHRDNLTLGDPSAYLKKRLVNVAIGLVLLVIVMATDHPDRPDRGTAGLHRVDHRAAAGADRPGSTINGSRSWLQAQGDVDPALGVREVAVVIGMALLVAERRRGRGG